jgi:6-phosphogluconolactonase (cycloisomerase 2 family)
MTYRGWLVLLVGCVAVAACDSSDEEDGGGDAGSGGASGGKAGSSSGGTASGAAGKAGGGGSSSKAGGGGSGGSAAGIAGAGGEEAGGAAPDSAGAAGAPSGVGGEGGLGGGEGGAGGTGEQPEAVAYVSTVLGELLVASLDPESGVPTLLPSSPIEVDGFLHGVAVHPTGKLLFVPAEPARIDTYPIAADGSLPEQPSFSAAVEDDSPMLGVALDPLGRFAYGVSPFSKTIYVFTVDQTTGELTPSAEPLLVGSEPDHRSPAFVAPDPTGQFVYVTQMAAGPAPDDGIRGYSVDQTTGELTELDASPFNAGGVIAGAIVFRPDGKFLYSSGAGLNAFAIGDDGDLTLVEGSPFTLEVDSDDWAPNITIDPQGKLLYVSDFLLTRRISGFSIDQQSGALTAVPGPQPTTAAPYSIALGPGGRFLYVADDNGETSVFGVARPSGTLTALANSPFPFGGLEADIAFAVLP